MRPNPACCRPSYPTTLSSPCCHHASQVLGPADAFPFLGKGFFLNLLHNQQSPSGPQTVCPPAGFDSAAGLDLNEFISAPWYPLQQVRPHCGMGICTTIMQGYKLVCSALAREQLQLPSSFSMA